MPERLRLTLARGQDGKWGWLATFPDGQIDAGSGYDTPTPALRDAARAAREAGVGVGNRTVEHIFDGALNASISPGHSLQVTIKDRED